MFDQLIRDGVALANELTGATGNLQVTVGHRRWISQSLDGTPTYAATVNLQAILEFRQEIRQPTSGQEQVSRAYLAILEPLAAQGAAGRTEPVDERDFFVLPDGSVNPVLESKGLADPTTNLPYFTEVWLGQWRGRV